MQHRYLWVWLLKTENRWQECHLQPLMLIKIANAICCHMYHNGKLKITYDQPITVLHPFSSQPITSLKLGNYLSFKKLPGKFIRSRPFGPLGQLEIAPQYECQKDWKISEQNRLNGLQMVQVECPRQSPCLIKLWSWVNPTFPLLALRSNKKWLPSLKMKEIENFQSKLSFRGCKWTS